MAAAQKLKRKAGKGSSRLPPSLSPGYVVRDAAKKKDWIVGKEIGSGGFGRVYLASDGVSKSENFVLKVEYHQNGPLFSEVHCYMSMGQSDQISEWARKKKLKYLGVSPAFGFGSFEEQESKYRFLVIERYGTDLLKVLKEKKVFSIKNACTIAISIVNSLEYIHNSGYLHCDIKAANLLLGRQKSTEHQVYLVDMGLAIKYIINGEHKKDVPDPKKAHNGTIEYMSRDAHRGTPCTRRSDFETLGYNILYWLCGSLPWEKITDCVKVQKMKEDYMSDLKKFVKVMFPEDDIPRPILDFLKYVNKLKFSETPNYDLCRQWFQKAIVDVGAKYDGKLNFNDVSRSRAKTLSSSTASSSSKENIVESVVKKEKVSKPQVKRKKEKTAISVDPSITLTPAMLEILNKKK